MKPVITLLGAAAVLALPSFAIANAQLSASLGVEPGVYSTSELAQMKAADSDDYSFFMGDTDPAAHERAIANAAFDEDYDIRQAPGTGEVFSTQSPALNPHLASAAGVEPGLYSLSELVQLKDARDADDGARYEFLIEKFDAR